jgi:hypothetical protein
MVASVWVVLCVVCEVVCCTCDVLLLSTVVDMLKYVPQGT